MDSTSTLMFTTIRDHMNSDMLNCVFAFWIFYFVFEPNMFYLIICAWKCCWHGCEIKIPKILKKYEKDSSSSNDSNKDRKKKKK